MKILEGDIVETLVDKNEFKAGSKGLVVWIYEGHNACTVEVWDETNYPCGVKDYDFSELKLIERDRKLYNWITYIIWKFKKETL